MPIYRNNDPSQGRYCIHPDGHVVFHEACQKTKAGWREAEESDLHLFSDHLLVHAGLNEAPPEVDLPQLPPLGLAVKITATGTIE